MILIYGGAYQGKLDFAREKFGFKEGDIFYCQESSAQIDLSKKVVYGFQKYVAACVAEGLEAADILPKLAEKILICDDISCGIVPIKREDRDMREMTGRALIKGAQASEEVYRVFCGLGQKLK